MRGPGELVLAAAGFLQSPEKHNLPAAAGQCGRLLVNLTRRHWQKPTRVIQALAIRPAGVMADIGAGTGYFSRRFARYAGKVYAVDIDAGDLEQIRRRAPANLVARLAAPDDPNLPEAAVDTIFLCDVLHHVDHRQAYYRKLARILRRGGRIAVIDFYKRKLPFGPPVARKIARQDMIADFERAGFRLQQSFDFLPYQYFLVFRQAR